MHTRTDIRAQVDADARLQQEINHALLAVADALASGSDRRLARILTRTLEASWVEHVSFQDDVVFPILIGRHGAGIADVIDARRSEHTALMQLHTRIHQHLERLLRAHHAVPGELGLLLKLTHAQRLSHLDFDTELEGSLPEMYTTEEIALCEKWQLARPNPRFPFNLLRKGDRPFPRLGDREH